MLINTRLEEASRTETFQGFYVLRNKHAQIEQEQITKMKEITDRKEHTVKALVDRVEAIQKELDNISCIRTGFFRGISKKTKSQKEEEANLRLVSAKKELEESMKSLAVDEITLREEYEHRKSEVLEQTACDLKEIERLETASQIDNSAEVRQITCEKLTDAIVSLKNRVEPIPKN
jgi:predicted DNA-binding ribbon-helix-helix protein